MDAPAATSDRDVTACSQTCTLGNSHSKKYLQARCLPWANLRVTLPVDTARSAASACSSQSHATTVWPNAERNGVALSNARAESVERSTLMVVLTACHATVRASACSPSSGRDRAWSQQDVILAVAISSAALSPRSILRPRRSNACMPVVPSWIGDRPGKSCSHR